MHMSRYNPLMVVIIEAWEANLGPDQLMDRFFSPPMYEIVGKRLLGTMQRHYFDKCTAWDECNGSYINYQIDWRNVIGDIESIHPGDALLNARQRRPRNRNSLRTRRRQRQGLYG